MTEQQIVQAIKEYKFMIINMENHIAEYSTMINNLNFKLDELYEEYKKY